jgi:hypothetical protein
MGIVQYENCLVHSLEYSAYLFMVYLRKKWVAQIM